MLCGEGPFHDNNMHQERRAAKKSQHRWCDFWSQWFNLNWRLLLESQDRPRRPPSGAIWSYLPKPPLPAHTYVHFLSGFSWVFAKWPNVLTTMVSENYLLAIIPLSSWVWSLHTNPWLYLQSRYLFTHSWQETEGMPALNALLGLSSCHNRSLIT